ncbi:Alba DNA/RNA-binding protein [Zea mays]|uniref:Alba DNA/RNA-binding protein n=1 Tax=Zea mays TaxID=4577 RepID=K7UY78_MAIZE|nr:Alba DNA/RNA-binding protein [Zea mays]
MSGDTAAAVQAGGDAQQAVGRNRIQVSSSKKPLFFYVNLAKRYMQHHDDDVELSALGLGPKSLSNLLAAISTAVTVAEILKNNGLAVEKKVRTSTVDIKNEISTRSIQKAKIEIVLGKTNKFDELMAANDGDGTAGDGVGKNDKFDELMAANDGDGTAGGGNKQRFVIDFPTIFISSPLLDRSS